MNNTFDPVMFLSIGFYWYIISYYCFPLLSSCRRHNQATWASAQHGSHLPDNPFRWGQSISLSLYTFVHKEKRSLNNDVMGIGIIKFVVVGVLFSLMSLWTVMNRPNCHHLSHQSTESTHYSLLCSFSLSRVWSMTSETRSLRGTEQLTSSSLTVSNCNLTTRIYGFIYTVCIGTSVNPKFI